MLWNGSTPSETDYGPFVEAREEKEEPREQEMNLLNIGVAWTSENQTLVRRPG